MTLPLEGVAVLDLSQIYNGPYATFLLAQAGADVIKVEPRGGEHLRRRDRSQGDALPYAMLNGCKRAITLDLKTARGKELLRELARRADVLVENFAPGVMDRLGVGWDVLHEHNPRLIYAASSGFGRTGPHRDYPAMDLTVQAFAGIMSVTGFPDGPPLKAGPAMCDFSAGTHLYGAIVTALYERERTGVGRLVEVSMQEAVYGSLASNLGFYQDSGGETPLRTGNRHGGLSVAPYNVYPASDGHIAIITVGEEQWRRLTAAMDLPELAEDPRFADSASRLANLDALDVAVAEFTRTRPKQELFELLTAHRVPAAPVRDLGEVVEDEHLHARGFLRRLDHPQLGEIVVQQSPIRFEGLASCELTPSAEIGAHNDEVFREVLGLSTDEIASLREEGVI
jgi:crotonobetainyl-CoA:carnitine CoA-transferase CaiB-like acyl-CoA transferase